MKEITYTKSYGRKRTVVKTINTEKSMCDGSFEKDCDINEIVRKFTKTGELTHLAKAQGAYMDVSELPDIHEALNTVRIAEDAFNMMDSRLRERFGNDPRAFYDFVNDPQNDEEAVKLGLKEILS